MQPPATKSRHLCLTDEEKAALTRRLAECRRPHPFTKAEADVVLDFAHEVRWASQTLQRLLAGEIEVDVVEGQLMLIAPEGRVR